MNVFAFYVCIDIVGIAVVTLLAGSWNYGFADGMGTQVYFNYPSGVAVDASGTVFVADYYNNRIRAISPTGGTWANCLSAVKQNLRLSIILSP